MQNKFRNELDKPYSLDQEKIKFFRQQGFVKLKDVFSADLLKAYGDEITRKVIELNTLDVPMDERTTYQKAFLQVMNLWRQSDIVREFVFGKRLAQIAAELLGCPGVRLYHDQALYKESGGGITPWHADQYYWPLATEKTCTAWIPLQETTMEMGPLAFAARSQHFSYGRSLPISDESEKELQAALKEANFQHIAEPFDLGELSFHYGWTFHHAGANVSGDPRKVMTIIYMDADMKLTQPANDHQEADHNAWCPGATVGEVIDTPLNPVLYRQF